MRRELALGGVGRLAFGEVDQRGALRARVLERGGEPIVRPLVDDRGEVGPVDVRIALGEQTLAMGDELALRAARKEDVIDGEADLAGVESLRPHDPLGRRLDRKVRRDDRRRLAAELERHRRQVPRGVGHHCPAGRARPGEHEVVEGQGREGGAAAAAVVEEGELVLGEIFRRDLDQEFRKTPRILRHLDHRPVAGGENAGERRKAQQHRKVPRHDDPHDAKRLRDQAIARAGKRQRIATLRRRGFIQPLRRFAAS